MTVLSIDSGDLDLVAELGKTGFISDATTNPLFVSQAGSDPRYSGLVDAAVSYANAEPCASIDDKVALAIDRLSVNMGVELSKLIPGFVSTEVDPRLSFDVQGSLVRARRIIAMYEGAGVRRGRILIKLAATWEGICAAKVLEAEGIRCNLTLVFGFAQAVACAQAKATLISPFVGRILDWHRAKSGFMTIEPSKDPGCMVVARVYAYYKKYGHRTIVMPASWRPSRGPGFELDEVK